MSEQLEKAQRLVVKIGSALLVDEGSGLRRDWLRALVEDIVRLRVRGQEVIIVSSGAVALGAERLDMAAKRQKLQDSQAAAAVGQIRLAHAWEEQFADHGITVAQILLTLDDTEVRRRYLNARETIDTLLGLSLIHI